MSNRTLDIHLLGRTFAIACPDGQEEPLHQAAQELHQRLEQLRQRTGMASLEQLAVMAALNLTYELTKANELRKVEQKQMEERISLLQNTVEQALSDRAQNHPKTVDDDSIRS